MSEIQPSTHSHFSVPQLSEEQRRIVKAIVEDHSNVIVNSVVGSGKTLTSLVTAMEWVSSHPPTSNVTGFSQLEMAGPDPKPIVLLVVYNRNLKEGTETQLRTRVPEHLQKYIEVQTIHGLGHHYFGGSGRTEDGDLYKWTKNKAKPEIFLPPFSLVIIDEAQDLSPIMFKFLYYVMAQLIPKRPQLLILGDPFEVLYRFNDADHSFLINADEKFKDVVAEAQFKRFRLPVCYRITEEMADWINVNLNPNTLDRAHALPTWNFEDYRKQIAEWWESGIKADEGRPSAPGSVEFYNKNKLGRTHWDQVDVIVDKIKHVLVQYGTNSFALLGTSFSNKFSPGRTIINRLYNVAGVDLS